MKRDSSRKTSIKIAESEEENRRCFPVMKQLREKLTAEEFVKRVAEQEREGYKLAFIESEGQVVGVAGFRTIWLRMQMRGRGGLERRC